MTSLHINFALKILLATHILVANADIYGYTDANGAVYLTDTPTQTTNPAKIDTATSLGTTAQTVGANHEKTVGVDGFFASDVIVPPAGRAAFVRPCGVRIARQSVTHQNRVAFIGVQCAPGFVGQSDRRKRRAAFQRKRVESEVLACRNAQIEYSMLDEPAV